MHQNKPMSLSQPPEYIRHIVCDFTKYREIGITAIDQNDQDIAFGDLIPRTLNANALNGIVSFDDAGCIDEAECMPLNRHSRFECIRRGTGDIRNNRAIMSEQPIK